ncbi:hypothetical protein A2316_03040 [Candidatus Falkowbacteria bacterium RIFOXYB2_FULL_38_15]|uniref:Glycerophosphoryl diester phosphodiesterase membrane domain-containing protein n=1 Tax=Candidatus Falkowbacteria bacterium RIFOXYA2_FULL_38_12 TaxID=1797993 RepID=A0A1F5S456_9BACT|nr:MAG: hypothetical protein A2257_01450 [Candidatus Falkowbacteria bacterium RIFOXYA2_FULL_38_12]OGF32480.1 MAG: hypothetical protein A2316_03040 [Candidatus Falkowbacteria bacterium RIFOXYB2_FULL_38_15]OGF42438.1 MAG: hypothetical protein A2555_00645 [Candidatus Falkowbacteria bacterium RIFOXYD2_FULL_39_16]
MIISATSLVKESWKIYKDNFLLFLKIISWLFIPTVIWTIIAVSDLTKVAAVPIDICLAFIYIILSLFVSIALILASDNLAKGKNVDLKELFNLTYSKLLPFLWVSILANLAIFGGILLLIVPGIIFAVLFSFAPMATLLDGEKGTLALSYSKKLVKDNFWGVLWRWVASYFMYGVIISVIALGLTYIIGIVTGELGVVVLSGDSVWWSRLISDGISFLSLPIFTIIGVLFYNSLKKEKGN